ncbi:MAG: ABC transporter ATP-binding protein/permease [Hyphomicrobiales bacterium]|nr:ABC transporter ATP-binding protein/permease [Hyphomicrobiales bacterium]
MRRRETIPVQVGPRQDWRTIATLTPYLWPRGEAELRLRVVVSVVLLVAAKVATVSVPVILKHAVDALTVAPGKVVAVPAGLLLAYGAARILALVFREMQGAIFTKVAERAIRQAALRTFRHLHRLSLRFHLERQTGGLSRAIERGSRAIEFVLRILLFNIVPTILEIAMVGALLWGFFNAWFALATLGTIVCYVAWTLLVTEWRIKHRRLLNDTDYEAHSRAVDSLLNYETVKYFGNDEHEAQRFDQALRAYERAAVTSKNSLSLLNTGQGVIIALGAVVVMTMAAFGVRDGTMTIGDFVLVNTYLLQLYMPLNFLGSVYREIKHSLTDMEQMFALLDRHPDVVDRPDARDLRLAGGEVRFEHVDFAYDERRTVLRDIDFAVPAGRTVAIVGPSGAGKSTVSRLLFRFYDPTAGRILIDGQDLRGVRQHSLRAAIGIVPQDTVLFNDTVYYNIAYGRPEAGRGEVEAAARAAQIHDFVAGLPDGYETRVGERGLKLSGGEKQRVAIARTVLKDPDILLFDEATSALDTHTEREIQNSLRSVSAGRTTIVIAHRLSTVVDADEILVLDRGRIVERGDHARLLALDGQYAAMWRRQQEAAQAREALARTGEDGTADGVDGVEGDLAAVP